ncbi:MAG TPA: hypothetical protein VMI31_15585 [Fimbriimonadaceae bacterium]|nr:hypothetical protein [Fimbriimonadaceae bacterium]
MKKRKTPILLFSLLVVLVGGVIVFGVSHGIGGFTKPDPTQQTLDPTQSPSSDSLLQATKGGSPSKLPRPDQAMPRPTSPTISLGTGPVMPKPQPNPNGTTSSQWYDH